MHRVCTLAAIIWIGNFSALFAQTISTPGMGATSPLGSSASAAETAAPAANIPMGATELGPAGISPLATPCPSASTSGSFDGGGVAMSTACGSASTTTSSGMGATTSGLSTSDASAASAGVSANSNTGIPLGATNLGTPGESQGAAIASSPVTPCTSTNSTATGTASSDGC